MKHFLTLITLLAVAFTTSAQSIDKDRMHRDLEVAENALGTIIKTETDNFPGWHFRDKDIEAEYIEDYGVVFNVSSNSYNYLVIADKVKHKDHKDGVEIDLKKPLEEEKDHFIENSKTFLADYAGIIGQLDESQKISIRRGSSGLRQSPINLEDLYLEGKKGLATTKTIWASDDIVLADSELTVEVNVGKINELRRGDISREEFFKMVKVVENVHSYEKDPDIETLVAMFKRLYKKDLSKTYYSEREPKYSKLSNFGVVIKMKLYSSYEHNDNMYYMPTIDKEGLTLEERNKYVVELLPQFEKDFRENLVNYGRTMKDLDSDEVLMFEINMTICKGCKDFPRFMKFSVKKSVLHKFNRGELDLNQAMEMVNVERIMK
ncbi:MAG: hypothetical protein AAGA77_05310 [Bacteroidota bacterium]